MKGKYKVIVKNNRLHYEFEIKRNITIIKGDSATGKTTLINMVRQFADLGNSSGIDIVCDAPCRVLEGSMWQILLQNMVGNIIFIDEENHFIRTKEFAEAVKESDNYFVIITRENLYNLPYSVEEIYGIHSSGKYQNTQRVYQEIYKIYPASNTFVDKPEKIIVEDTNSGYEFFKSVANEHGITCESAGGKTKLFGEQENAADLFAEDSLIPREQYNDFVASGRFGLNDIIHFTKVINRDPGIVLGRLQNDGLVGFDDWTMKPIRHKYKVKKAEGDAQHSTSDWSKTGGDNVYPTYPVTCGAYAI